MAGPDVIVVGVDGSEVANDALVFAADEADRRDSKLIVAHAGRPTHARPAGSEVQAFDDILRQEVVATLAETHPRLGYQIVQRATDPADLLIELAREADLLVVGTHRAGRLRGFVLGSVSQRVAAQAACTVMTISGAPAYPDGPIVLGASASPGGTAALHFACREARLHGRPMRVVRSITTEDRAVPPGDFEVGPASEALHAAARAELDAILRESREAYPDLTIYGEVWVADPFSALLDAADEASLLVIGSRRSPDSALPHLGPVAAWLLHQATCPLAIVGEAAATDPAA
jgi:nucleotide-binding universal stress UspA family protein